MEISFDLFMENAVVVYNYMLSCAATERYLSGPTDGKLSIIDSLESFQGGNNGGVEGEEEETLVLEGWQHSFTNLIYHFNFFLFSMLSLFHVMNNNETIFPHWWRNEGAFVIRYFVASMFSCYFQCCIARV